MRIFKEGPLLTKGYGWRSYWLTCAMTAAALLVGSLVCVAARAQTVEDGVMLSRDTLCTGVMYTHSRWHRYWEGSLERVNGNLGAVTTQMATASANYGITNRINVIADVPYVWTNASEGVLHGQSGFQDVTLAAKVNALQFRAKEHGTVRAIGVLSTSLPMTNYTPDLQPLSIGLHSRTLQGRATLNYTGRRGLYVNGTSAYTFRGNVQLDRSSYYTNGQLYLSSEVAMPNQFDYGFGVGYYRRDLKLVGTFAQQQTRGGGDIRRQDMPFVSNRMNYSKAGVELQWPLPRRLRDVQYWAAYENTFEGRNVGQANTIRTGLMYTFHRERRTAP